jgi:hypothetical protein
MGASRSVDLYILPADNCQQYQNNMHYPFLQTQMQPNFYQYFNQMLFQHQMMTYPPQIPSMNVMMTPYC